MRHPRYNWRYWTTPQKELYGRKLYWPRGKILGGSGSINGTIYIRGHSAIYDQWGQDNAGWSFREVLPYFKKSEKHLAWHLRISWRRRPLAGGTAKRSAPF